MARVETSLKGHSRYLLPLVLLRNLLLFMLLGLPSLLLGVPRRALKQYPLHLWLINLLNHAILNLSLERVIRIRLIRMVLCADFAMRCFFSLD